MLLFIMYVLKVAALDFTPSFFSVIYYGLPIFSRGSYGGVCFPGGSEDEAVGTRQHL